MSDYPTPDDYPTTDYESAGDADDLTQEPSTDITQRPWDADEADVAEQAIDVPLPLEDYDHDDRE